MKRKDLLLLANKLMGKIPDPRNANEHYEKQKSELITYQPKIFENPNIVEIRPLITKHLKASHKLSKTIRMTISRS